VHLAPAAPATEERQQALEQALHCARALADGGDPDEA